MTIRSGGRPRDRSQAHPARPGPDDRWEPAYADAGWGDDPRRGGGNGGNGGYGRNGGRRGGVPTVVKFLVFAVVLGAVVLLIAFTALRPLVRDAIIGWASDNPGALGVPFVADLVKEDLGPALTEPASDDETQTQFVVTTGESATTIARRLEEEGFVTDRRAFIFHAVEQDLAQSLEVGTFILRRSMTPAELVAALLDPEVEVRYVDIDLRTGLRLEQVTAKLQTIEGLELDPRSFYDLAHAPTADLLADYPWLELPEGASLEGYLWPATYRVLPDTSGEELVRLMLDGFEDAIGDRMEVPAERGLTFHQVLTLASMVEREAILDEERPLIAGVFENRLDRLNGFAPVLNSDPTVFYAIDTMELSALPFERWPEWSFWELPGTPLNGVEVPPELAGYQTYQNAGLPPSPICTPTLTSIDAALAPDTTEGYLYFVAKQDGSNSHAFARNEAEHQANLVEYGYR